MGIEDRHYYRDGSYTSSFSSFAPSSWPPVCRFIIFANLVIYLLQVFSTRPVSVGELQRRAQEYATQRLDTAGQEGTDFSGDELLPFAPGMQESAVQKALELDPRKVKQGQVWRLITGAFCHDRHGLMHILFNMLFVYWFGRSLEMMYGSREFLFFYFAAVIVSSLTFLFVALWTNDMTPAIGASGAVMAIVVLYAIHYPYEKIFLSFIFPIEIRWLVLIYVAYDVHPVLLALTGENVGDGIAHSAHLGGLLFGWSYWYSGMRVSQSWDRMRLPQIAKSVGVKPTARVMDGGARRDDRLKQDVDSILQQISENGLDSLDEQQREFLDRASKKYKDGV